MSIDKFALAQKALNRFEKLYGEQVIKVFAVANGYISRELTDGMVAGVPQRAILDKKKLWVVPIILTKKAGGYSEIGAILIDDQTHSILGSTDKSEIIQKAEMILDEKAKAA
ncbi:MAG: hypothetical protein MUC94_14805 [bacterium]|nr:hypothetical protein [bacterium]